MSDSNYKRYILGHDPATMGEDVSVTVKRELRLPEIKSKITIDEREYRQSNESELLDMLKGRLAHDIVHEFIKGGHIRIHNVTNEILNREPYRRLTKFEEQVLEDYHNRGLLTYTAEFDPKAENGYTWDSFNGKVKADPRNTEGFSKKDAEFLWKLLPPRINGRDEQKHPLQPGWMGTIKRSKDEQIINRVKEILNKYE